MEELIDRSLRGEASEAELAQLAEWRRASSENERRYRATVRLLEVARRQLPRELGTVAAPSVAAVIARADARRRAPLTVRHPWLPWALSAAAVVVAAVSLARSPASAPAPTWGGADIVTGAGELATVQLGDGSVVRLAPSSRLR